MLSFPTGIEAPPGDGPMGIAPPPFGAPTLSPERQALVAGATELAKQVLDLMSEAAKLGDQRAVTLFQMLASFTTKVTNQLAEPPSPLMGEGPMEPLLDRTPPGMPFGAPPMPPPGGGMAGPMGGGNPLAALLMRARGGG